jgi:hypothetical protein
MARCIYPICKISGDFCGYDAHLLDTFLTYFLVENGIIYWFLCVHTFIHPYLCSPNIVATLVNIRSKVHIILAGHLQYCNVSNALLRLTDYITL